MAHELAAEESRYIPFHVATGNDEFGFTPDGEEQRVVYPSHCNVPTRIYFDDTCHDILLQRDADGRPSILIVPKAGLSVSSV